MKQLVMLSSAIGYTPEEIGRIVALPLTVSGRTINRRFKEELATGHLRANAMVASTLYGVATTSGHPKVVTAGIFWLKARAQWKDGSSLTIKPGKPDPEGAADGETPPMSFTLVIGDKEPNG